MQINLLLRLIMNEIEEKIAKLESDLAFAQSMAETWKNNAKSWELLYEVAKMELKLKNK